VSKRIPPGEDPSFVLCQVPEAPAFESKICDFRSADFFRVPTLFVGIDDNYPITIRVMCATHMQSEGFHWLGCAFAPVVQQHIGTQCRYREDASVCVKPLQFGSGARCRPRAAEANSVHTGARHTNAFPHKRRHSLTSFGGRHYLVSHASSESIAEAATVTDDSGSKPAATYWRCASIVARARFIADVGHVLHVAICARSDDRVCSAIFVEATIFTTLGSVMATTGGGRRRSVASCRRGRASREHPRRDDWRKPTLRAALNNDDAVLFDERLARQRQVNQLPRGNNKRTAECCPSEGVAERASPGRNRQGRNFRRKGFGEFAISAETAAPTDVVLALLKPQSPMQTRVTV